MSRMVVGLGSSGMLLSGGGRMERMEAHCRELAARLRGQSPAVRLERELERLAAAARRLDAPLVESLRAGAARLDVLERMALA